jgi:hypothetical protein
MGIEQMEPETLDFIKKNPYNWEKNYYSARYLGWPKNSYDPLVKIIGVVGDCNDIEIECEALLRENEVILF